MDGKQCKVEDAPWVLWQLIYRSLGIKEDRRNFAHTCKNVHDAVLQEITRLELHLGDGVPACLSELESMPKPLLPDAAGPTLKRLTITGRRGYVHPSMLPLMRAIDRSATALHSLQNVESLILEDVDIGTDLLGWSMSRNCPHLKYLKLRRVDFVGTFWETLACSTVTQVCLVDCRGRGIIRGLSALKSLTDVAIEGPWSEPELGALSLCPKLTGLALLDCSYVEYVPSPGLATVLQACPIAVLQVPHFATLHGCGSASVKLLHVKEFKMGEPPLGGAHDFIAKFPTLLECMLSDLKLPNDCSLSEAAVRAQRVRQSASFLAALAQSGLCVQSGHFKHAQKVLQLSGSSLRPTSEVDQMLLSALSPLSSASGSQRVGWLQLQAVAISVGAMHVVASIWPCVSILVLGVCSICESGLVAAVGSLPMLTHVVIYGFQVTESTARAAVTACGVAQGMRRSLRLLLMHKPGQEDLRSACLSCKSRCNEAIRALPGPHTAVSCEVMEMKMA